MEVMLMAADNEIGEVVWEDLQNTKKWVMCNVEQRRTIQDIMWKKGFKYATVIGICKEVSRKPTLRGMGEVSKEEADKVIKIMEAK